MPIYIIKYQYFVFKYYLHVYKEIAESLFYGHLLRKLALLTNTSILYVILCVQLFFFQARKIGQVVRIIASANER